MIRQFELENKLDSDLSKYTDSLLNQLYLRVFNTDDGLLVLKDLANRCYMDIPTTNDKEEGMRCAYLSIITRMRRATTKGGK